MKLVSAQKICLIVVPGTKATGICYNFFLAGTISWPGLVPQGNNSED